MSTIVRPPSFTMPQALVEKDVIIEELMKKHGFYQARPLDSKYFCPSYEWLRSFMDWYGRLVLPRAEENRFDCEQFARTLAHYADIALAQAELTASAGHTVGEADVFLNAGDFLGISGPGYHACNIIRLNDGEWWAIEPQTARYAKFSDVEHVTKFWPFARV